MSKKLALFTWAVALLAALIGASVQGTSFGYALVGFFAGVVLMLSIEALIGLDG